MARARNVLLFSPTSKIKDDNGIPGVLVVTNFKLSFISFDDVSTIFFQNNVVHFEGFINLRWCL